jgi:hypothetical protein
MLMIERWEQLAHHQIAGATEEHHVEGLNGYRPLVPHIFSLFPNGLCFQEADSVL